MIPHPPPGPKPQSLANIIEADLVIPEKYTKKRTTGPTVNDRTAEERVRLNTGGKKTLAPPATESLIGAAVGHRLTTPAGYVRASQKDIGAAAIRYFLTGQTRANDEPLLEEKGAPQFAFLTDNWWKPPGKSQPRMPDTARAPPKEIMPVKEVSERLLRKPKPPEPLKPLAPTKKVSSTEHAAILHRLYDVEILRQQKYAESVKEQLDKDRPATARKIDDLQEYTERLITRPLMMRKKELDSALAPYIEKAKQEKKLTKEQQENVTSRVYAKAVQRKTESLKKAVGKYVFEVEEKYPRRSAEEWNATVTRLAVTGPKK